MNVFARDDVVLFHDGPGYVGTITDTRDSGYLRVSFDNPDRGAWLLPESLTKLPAGTPVFRNGDTARVACDAAYYADHRGTIAQPGFQMLPAPHGDTFGYWIDLHAIGEQVWIPAAALEPVKDGENHG